MRLITFDSTTVSIDGIGYNNLNSITGHTISKMDKLTEKEKFTLKKSLLVLSRNNINALSSSRCGFIIFNHKPIKGPEWYQLRLITVDADSSRLYGCGFKTLDKAAGIVLSANR